MEKDERSRKTIVFFVSKESTLAGGDHPESVLILDDKLIRSALERAGYSVEVKLWDFTAASSDLFSNRLCLVRSVWNWVECYVEFREFLERAIDISPALPLVGDFQGVKLCSYKKYLPQFGDLLTDDGDAVIPIVPTVFVEKKKGASLKRIKMIASAKGWREVVLKPAVGGRGDGVERIDFRREVPADVADYFDAQLEVADYLLQPFLPDVMRLGEKCLVFIGGTFAHAIRKVPDGWRDEATTQGRKPKDVAPAGILNVDAEESEAGDHPVEVFTPDDHLMTIAEKVLAQIPDGPPLFARVDFLPLSDTQWVFSEFEVSWPDLFLRACPKSADLIPGAIDTFLQRAGHGEPPPKKQKIWASASISSSVLNFCQ